MIGCIFAPTMGEYYEICERCGVKRNNSNVHNILFDLNSRFLLAKIIELKNQGIKVCINSIINDGVYPGELEIETRNYNIRYTYATYFTLVNAIINNKFNVQIDSDSDEVDDEIDEDEDEIF